MHYLIPPITNIPAHYDFGLSHSLAFLPSLTLSIYLFNYPRPCLPVSPHQGEGINTSSLLPIDLSLSLSLSPASPSFPLPRFLSLSLSIYLSIQ